MATKSKADKSKPADGEQDIPVDAPEETTFADAPAAPTLAEEPVPVIAAAAVPEPAVEIVDIVSAPLAVIEMDSASQAFTATFEFDASAWPKKTFELWAEHAAAFLDLAERVARAQTLEEVIDLQSKFASTRFEAFVRQSQELMDLARNLAAPLCEVRKAA